MGLYIIIKDLHGNNKGCYNSRPRFLLKPKGWIKCNNIDIFRLSLSCVSVFILNPPKSRGEPTCLFK